MVLKSEREVMQTLIKDALTELCVSKLQFSSSVSIEALIGITLDESDVLLVNVKETLPANEQRPHKRPRMQVALKSVEKAVQKINTKSPSGAKSPSIASPPKRAPTVINIVPIPAELAETHVALGTVDMAPELASVNMAIKVKEESDDASEKASRAPSAAVDAEQVSCTQIHVFCLTTECVFQRSDKQLHAVTDYTGFPSRSFWTHLVSEQVLFCFPD